MIIISLKWISDIEACDIANLGLNKVKSINSFKNMTSQQVLQPKYLDLYDSMAKIVEHAATRGEVLGLDQDFGGVTARTCVFAALADFRLAQGDRLIVPSTYDGGFLGGLMEGCLLKLEPNGQLLLRSMINTRHPLVLSANGHPIAEEPPFSRNPIANTLVERQIPKFTHWLAGMGRILQLHSGSLLSNSEYFALSSHA